MEKKEILRSLERQKEAIHRRKKELVEGLPHLYGWKWYAWARAFFNSTNKMNLLCAANQISKSSTQIRKCIDWATDLKKWPLLWEGRKPKIFWYLYPSLEVATVEFDKKWVPEFMPALSFKAHPVYGWREERGEKRTIAAIHFFSGVSVYFKTYSQAAINLQTSTCDAIFADEEMPENLYSELHARLIATNGYFHMVFTATLNQEMWYRAIEGSGREELFPNAFKQQVAMHDCLLYDDGSPGAFTLERIKEIEAGCKSDAERQRRVHGRFISDSGRKYHAFNPAKHYVKPFPIPQDWVKLCAVDLGSGLQNHPAAIVFLAVRPDMRYGVVYKAWRGDTVETTDGDVYEKFLQMRRGELLAYQLYDAAGKDFGTIAMRAGDNFIKAEKSHEVGESIVNTLFQNDMLQLFDDNDDIRKLGVELLLLLQSTPKQKAKDDLCDGLRYNSCQIPWDFSQIKIKTEGAQDLEPKPLTLAELKAEEMRERRGETVRPRSTDIWPETEDEFDYWNSQYGA
jgi:phage terminase large subunit-like protein